MMKKCITYINTCNEIKYNDNSFFKNFNTNNNNNSNNNNINEKSKMMKSTNTTGIQVDTRRRFNVYKTSIRRRRRRIDVP